jgi:haloalkane dehalogenase
VSGVFAETSLESGYRTTTVGLMASEQAISADFTFEPHYVEVAGSRMHYVDEGEGDPILFLHGNPTSSYLWRNVIPHLTDKGRCIAPDLVGFGKSDKPDIGYRFVDHAPYVQGFIEALGLENVTLVIHDWGSALGLNYAMAHQENVKGIAMMEAMMAPMSWADIPRDFKRGFKLFRTPGIGYMMISVGNMFVKRILPEAVVRDLTPEEKRHYAEPFPTIKSRKPVYVWPNEIPIDGKPDDVHQIISDYSTKLQESELPKLLFTAEPGGIVDATTVAWAKTNLPNLTVVDIGPGIHFVQEDNPHMIGTELAAWYDRL